MPRSRPPQSTPRPAIVTAFTLSWDGRILGQALPKKEITSFRRRLSAGLIEELHLTWRPCLTGAQAHPPITGFDPKFLPHGIVLDLLKLQRKPDGYLAAYRVRRTRR